MHRGVQAEVPAKDAEEGMILLPAICRLGLSIRPPLEAFPDPLPGSGGETYTQPLNHQIAEKLHSDVTENI